MTNPGLPLVAALGAAVRFVPSAWKAAWPSMVLVTALLTASIVLNGNGWTGAGLALAALASLVDLEGRLYAVAPPAPGGRLSRDLRLLAVLLLKALLLGILGMLLFVLTLAAAFAVASAGPGFDPADVATWARAVDVRGRMLVQALWVLGLASLAWTAMRLALAEPATAAEGRVRVLAAWGLTRGFEGRLSLALLVLNVPPGLALWALARAAFGQAPDRPAAWLAAMGAGIVTAALLLPLNVGLTTYLHRQIPHPGPE